MRCLKIMALGLLLAGCRDGGPLNPLQEFLGQPNAAISHGGTSHFFWLPPVAKGEPTPTGVFNAGLRPTVTICAVSDRSAPGREACGTVLQDFASSEVGVSTTDEHYLVNWHTDSHPGVVAGTYYRMLVRVSRFDLGYADVYVAPSAKDLKALDSATLGLVHGRTLPIRFRIEHGAVSWAAAVSAGRPPLPCNDCVEQVVTSGGETVVVTPARHAGAYLPAAAIPAEYGEVVFTINRINPLSSAGPCFPATVPGEDPMAVPLQAEGCFEYNTEPMLADGFGAPVQIAMCLDQEKSLDRHALFKYSPTREDKFSQLQPTRYGPPTYLTSATCASFQASAPLAQAGPASRLLNLARSGWSAVSTPLGQLFGPGTLNATDAVLAGEVVRLSPSRIGMGESLAVGASAGNSQTAEIGATLPITPTIEVLSGRRGHPLVTASAGVPVRIDVYFAVDSLDNIYAGADSLDNLSYPVDSLDNFSPVDSLDNFPVDSLDNIYSAIVRTDANGRVEFSWTLGNNPGTYLLKATVPGAARTLLRAKATSPVSVSVAPTSATICVDKTQQFTATVSGITDGRVQWTSSNPQVAAVNSDGQVTGVSAGTAMITATSAVDGTKSASAAVTVPSDCALPDLIVFSVGDAPSTSEPGKHQITARVRNQGSATAGASIMELVVSDGVNQILSTRFSVPELTAGSDTVFTASFTPEAGMTYTASAVADVDSVVSESIETNNTQQHRFTPISGS